MKGENSWRNPKPLKQKAGCRGCGLARKEIKDRAGNLHITKEVCLHGGLVAVEEGSMPPFSCHQ